MTMILSGGVVADVVSGSVVERDIVVEGAFIGGSPDGAQRIDVSGCMILPGLVCSHHHLYSALARGMPGPDEAPRNFPEILERIWWRLDRALDLETIELSARLAAVEALRAGTTSLIDHHASPECIDSSLDAVASGIAAAGARAVVCYEVTDRHGNQSGRRGVEENARFIRENRNPLVKTMVGAHASFTIGDSTMEALVATARDEGVPIHIHVAEDFCDESDSLDKYGVRTAHRLAKAGALDEGDLIAHGVHLDASEIETVRAAGVWIAHNPRSNMNNRVGYAPVTGMGERVGLGTDGIDGDMFAEARACYLKAREHSVGIGPDFPVARLAAGAAIIGASFGLPTMGRLDPGAPADLVVLEYRPPTPVTPDNLAGHFVFGMGSTHVRDVMVGGQWLVRERSHTQIDEVELAAECRAAAPRLWDRMNDL
jgi:putative selenium metabolism protein SsnA